MRGDITNDQEAITPMRHPLLEEPDRAPAIQKKKKAKVSHTGTWKEEWLFQPARSNDNPVGCAALAGNAIRNLISWCIFGSQQRRLPYWEGSLPKSAIPWPYRDDYDYRYDNGNGNDAEQGQQHQLVGPLLD
jgi:hypothetical protein